MVLESIFPIACLSSLRLDPYISLFITFGLSYLSFGSERIIPRFL